jgi:hypothetical protein
MLYCHVLFSDVQSFLGYPWVVSGVHALRFLFHCGGPVYFQISTANGLEVVKFQASLMCSYRVKRINFNRGAGCGFRWLVSSGTEDTLVLV